ncbi:hypothetical protein MLD38_022279 [Melastoma candidum]|uniref:Uncharacterized protein n=1 Tax=Melastoma candidum TaxID=119954 RepID=A0ACB9QLS2_9MYRT|nr:hypothetical protein MLD38_022279 [Melastoma candidum]
MSWFGKFFKGFGDKTPGGGHYRDHNGLFPAHSAPSSSGDVWSRYENEDIDRAIALSLAEENQTIRNIPDKRKSSQLEDDEQLARAIQESLNFKSPPRGDSSYAPNSSGNGHLYRPNPYYYPTGLRICAGCKREIGHGRFLSYLNAFWHPECFCCHGCGSPISDYEFSVSGNSRYHKYCYKEHHYPKCDVCKHFIPTNAAGLVEYRAHPFWMQKYCPNHERDGTPRCCSCERMEPRGTDYVHLNDGRKLCLECLDSAFMDTSECQPLYRSIQKFYEGLNMKVEQQVPLLLVERQALNEAREGERNGHYHMPETRGLCLSEERTVSSISRRPRFRGGRATDIITEPFKLTRFCEVTAILVLYGLPRLLTGSILAHEMMHAWLRLKGFRTLRQDVEEGICQVIAYMWLDEELSSSVTSNSTASSSSSQGEVRGPRTHFERKLGEFFKHQIESDRSPVYGDGFRAGRQAVQRPNAFATTEYRLYKA